MTKIYTTPGCMQCRTSKNYMDKNGIHYEAIDVTEDEQAYEHVKSLGYNSAPVLETDDGRHWFGFRPDMLETLVA